MGVEGHAGPGEWQGDVAGAVEGDEGEGVEGGVEQGGMQGELAGGAGLGERRRQLDLGEQLVAAKPGGGEALEGRAIGRGQRRASRA